MISLFHPYVPRETSAYLDSVLLSKNIGQGKKVEEFEYHFCDLFNTNYAVSVNSGTSALETAYDLIGLKEGDEVITTPLTCTATNIPLLHRGVKIVWADILESTLCIDPLDVRSKITDKTKAIVQVHLGGIKANVGLMHSNDDGLPKPIPVVSDAAQALGIFNGDYTCCSFQAIKHITTGDGGMLVCKDQEEYHRAKLIRWFGIDREKRYNKSYKLREMTYDIEMLGYKRHMNDIQAMMGLVGLRHYDEMMAHRRKIFDIYREGFKDISGLRLVDGRENTYWLATVIVENRDEFAKMLENNEVETNIVQRRNDVYKIFGGVREDLPVMNAIEDKYLSLPIGIHVTEEEAHYIVNIIKSGW